MVYRNFLHSPYFILYFRPSFTLWFDLGIPTYSLLISVLASGSVSWIFSQLRFPATWHLALFKDDGLSSAEMTGFSGKGLGNLILANLVGGVDYISW